MSKGVDEDEHSLEMHLPYIYKMLSLKNTNFQNDSTSVPLVPIMVGNTDAAIEARYGSGYARSQAAETAKVGRTLMIFTVVTIIFLPMSFLAAFFAINIKELPHVDNEQQMSLSFVMQNVVGVGLGTALAFVLIAWHHHRALDWLRRLPKQMRTLAEIVASMSSRESRQEIPKGIKKPTTTNHGVHG